MTMNVQGPAQRETNDPHRDLFPALVDVEAMAGDSSNSRSGNEFPSRSLHDETDRAKCPVGVRRRGGGQAAGPQWLSMEQAIRAQAYRTRGVSDYVSVETDSKAG
jgi:hypothetical protein